MTKESDATPARKPKQATKSAALQAEYDSERARAERLLACARDELVALLDAAGIALGVPIEGRVKDWESIAEKVDRKALNLSTLSDLPDLVGLRVILLFRGDVSKVEELINENFSVISAEDAAERLSESQFGYQSQHYLVRLKPEWLKVPRYKDLGNLSIEMQVRTLAQHMWAAASHKLQYKREESVPNPLRRTIHRVSALLETVDLELDRVVVERETYVSTAGVNSAPSDKLNVDLLRILSKDLLPEVNYGGDEEEFDSILRELEEFGIDTAEQFRSLVTDELDSVLEEDRKTAIEQKERGMEVIAKDAFYRHMGLTRLALIHRYGRDRYGDMRQRLGTWSKG